ncbi:MAG: GNAT family N-acetyltransferase [Gemmatimonadetes bacterium]|jgi:acyl-CoA hydrolase/GNAT superfamily N-acetyltransferase|nr:GNAT family N-acetyltransferase [Gemmatimonadota bacterium]MBT5590906.1 GNAT family N-acetyltransferase [Gemmatimonadota bacterium]MBT6627857.1 GNAT family N-acetyltransferase [Gemmatimonadota bacterium]MBT7455547.1 GNAT family N-acetyltransferase [Gemmatimonadota bacterium]MBT7595407.1 GNAT family N-acetyltransferase [Gemmatimonadota bacterium]
MHSVRNWRERYTDKIRSAEEAVGAARAGHRVFIGSGAAEPQTLVEALSERKDISDAEIVHILTLGVATYAEPRLGNRFRHNAYFIGANVRDAVSEGRADYTPIFLSEIPALFREERVRIDVALVEVSPPDEHGYCSYGVSTDIVKAATESARVVVAEVNEQMPRALGDCFVHVRDIDVLVPTDRPILEARQGEPDELSQKIARHIANLIEDGSTLQMGIGTIPDAVLHYLSDSKDLGIHTEMFSDGIIPLVEKGVITNSAKTLHRGKIVASFVMGSRKLYDFIDNNPLVEFHPTEYTNDPFIIAQNDKMVAINAAIEVDLTGQVCADSLGTLFYSGIGGQVDFVRGAARSRGGKPIIALPSTAVNGTISRITPSLKPGAGIVTSRGDVHYVVTEYGTAYLHGKTMRERAMALIQIAHPKFRPWLLAEAKTRNLVYADQIEQPVRMTLYPDDIEQSIELKNGEQAFLRPLKLTDEPLVRDLFYRLSPEAIHYRFFRSIHSMPHTQLQDLMTIDYESDMAMVVLTDRTQDARMLAIGHYLKDQRTNFAESAFLVLDEWQNLGIGTKLMASLAETARCHGVVGFTAEVLADNLGMLRVFHKCGYAVESTLADGVHSLRISF